MVQVEVNGLGEVLRVQIDPELVARGDREMIEDLLPAAVNPAVEKANQLRLEAIQSMAKDLNLPGLDAAACPTVREHRRQSLIRIEHGSAGRIRQSA